jgi:hypothetical protein
MGFDTGEDLFGSLLFELVQVCQRAADGGKTLTIQGSRQSDLAIPHKAHCSAQMALVAQPQPQIAPGRPSETPVSGISTFTSVVS